MKIVDVNHGIANRFSNHIEINKNLRNYPNLLTPILKHEFAHTNKVISKKDFKLDFIFPETLHYKELFKFMFKHPKSFTQLLPIYWAKGKGFVYDINLTIMYLFMIGIITVTIWFGLKYL